VPVIAGKTVIVASLGALVAALASCGGSDDAERPSLIPGSSPSFPVVVASPLLEPEDVIYDDRGTLYVSDFGGDVVIAIAADGTVSPVAGVGMPGTSGDGVPAVEAELDSPSGMSWDAEGRLVFADHDNGCIRRIESDGTLTTIAGSCGHVGPTGDGGPAIDAHLNDPIGITFDRQGRLVIADEQNGRVRRVGADGTITTIAGGGDRPPKDGVRATEAELSHPSYVVIGPDDRIYFSDFLGNVVWAIERDGTLTAVAGDGSKGDAGDGGPATQAELDFPTGLIFDGLGDLFITDADNNAIRMVDPSGTITTIAGTGDAGFAGDGGPAAAALLTAPAGLTIDPDGNLVIADQGNGVVRRVDLTSHTITTLAGSVAQA
jgi:sugar lactone lactonase YvrE